MSHKAEDMTGKMFGRLLITSYAPNRVTPSGQRKSMVNCYCLCGRVVIAAAADIRNGHTTSCGCYHKDAIRTHGKTKHPIYSTWKGMLARCYNKKRKGYENYGGRGIRVCPEWHDFFNFYRDMGDKPSPDFTLDRIDANGDYTPQNCRWADWDTQARNKRPLPLGRAQARGVYQSGSRFVAQVRHNKITTHVGSFASVAEAVAARDTKIQLLTQGED